MKREELHTQAEQNMKQGGIIGDAWLYIYEQTGPVYAQKSIGWVKTQLRIASNDPNVSSIKRRLYQDMADLLE